MSLTRKQIEEFKHMSDKEMWNQLIPILIIFISKNKTKKEVRAATEAYIGKMKALI